MPGSPLDVFISYGRSDFDSASRIRAVLLSLGYSVWLDDELPVHRAYSEVIEERLLAARVVVVIWSRESVKSQWVRAEAESARVAGTLIQTSIDGTRPPLPFNQIQCADMAGWGGDVAAPGWRKVLASIEILTGNLPTPIARHGTADKISQKSWLVRLATATVILAAAAFVGDRLISERSPEPLANQLGESRGSSENGEKAIAVLPFVSISSDPQYAFIADGVSDEILNLLSSVQGLRVTSRTSSFSFKGKQVDLPTLAGQLGVSYVVEGSVRKEGNRLRVSAQLIDVDEDATLWSDSYEREFDDVFVIEAEVSAQIAKVLKIAMSADELNSIGQAPTADLEAWQQFLRASLLFRNRTQASSLDDALELVDAAISRDPTFARAYALRATLLQSLAKYSDAKRSKEYWTRALADADYASELDPTLGEPHLVRALHSQLSNGWNDAYRGFRDAIARAPGNPDGRVLYGQFLMSVGYLERGWAEYQRAWELDPLSPIISSQVAFAAFGTDRFDIVQLYIQRAHEKGWPAGIVDALLGGVAMRQGNLVLAQRQFLKVLPERQMQIERSIDAMRTKTIDPDTRAMLDQLGVFGPPGIARWSVEAYIGDVGAAMASLHSTVDPASLIKPDGSGGPVRPSDGTPSNVSAAWPDIWFSVASNVRRDPRFSEFVRAIDLIRLWRESGWPDLCRPVGDSVECV